MKQITINVYSFKELNEKAKQKAIDKYYHLEQLWYSHIYDSAESVGIKIEYFDIDRNDLEIKDTKNFPDIAEKTKECMESYIKDGYKAEKEDLKLYEETKDYLCRYTKLKEDLEKTDLWEEIDDIYDQINDLHMEYKGCLEGYYLICLKREYEHYYSDTYIQDYFEYNQYNFNEDGFIIY
jgi:hypothetical protein